MQTEKNTIIVIKTILVSLIKLMTSRFEKQRRILASIVAWWNHGPASTKPSTKN